MGAVLSWLGAMMSSLRGGAAAAQHSAESSSKKSSVIVFNSPDQWQRHFNETKKIAKLMVVDFSASWCGNCKTMEPIFNAMPAKFTGVEFIKIDFDKFKDVAKEYGVQGVPTFVLLKQGKEVDRVVGANKDELEKKVKKHRVS